MRLTPIYIHTIIITGKTVSTGFMERTAVPPVKVSGVEFISFRQVKKDKKEVRDKVLRERAEALEAKNASKNQKPL